MISRIEKAAKIDNVLILEKFIRQKKIIPTGLRKGCVSMSDVVFLLVKENAAVCLSYLLQYNQENKQNNLPYLEHFINAEGVPLYIYAIRWHSLKTLPILHHFNLIFFATQNDEPYNELREAIWRRNPDILIELLSYKRSDIKLTFADKSLLQEAVAWAVDNQTEVNQILLRLSIVHNIKDQEILDKIISDAGFSVNKLRYPDFKIVAILIPLFMQENIFAFRQTVLDLAIKSYDETVNESLLVYLHNSKKQEPKSHSLTERGISQLSLFSQGKRLHDGKKPEAKRMLMLPALQ